MAKAKAGPKGKSSVKPAKKQAPAKAAPGKPKAKAPAAKSPAKDAKKGSKAPLAGKGAVVPKGKGAAAGVGGGVAGKKGGPAPAPVIVKKPSKPKISDLMPIPGKPLANLVRKPLIQSGPKAPPVKNLASMAAGAGEERKSPLNKTQLTHYRGILVRKRAELIGDVSTMETQALQGNSGSLSALPQHSAEQGSDVYDQSLALDLAAADRRLIKEIDDAIKRIDSGTYGLCEITGKPIKIERLDELPWARMSIEAAREVERRSHSMRSHAPVR